MYLKNKLKFRIGPLLQHFNKIGSVELKYASLSYRKTTLICTWKDMKLARILFILCLRYLLLGLVIGVFEDTSKILCKFGCKTKCYTLQRLSKNHIWCERKNFTPKVHYLVENLIKNVSYQLGPIVSTI